MLTTEKPPLKFLFCSLRCCETLESLERERDENEKDSIRDDTLQTYRREEIGTNREKL